MPFQMIFELRLIYYMGNTLCRHSKFIKCLFLSSRETKSYTLNSKEDSSLAQLLRDTDPPITSCRTGKDSKVDNGGGSQQSQYEQSKFFDGGENFVDPNKVLPGHCIGKGKGLKTLHLCVD